MACSGKEMEVKVEEEKTASMGATQTHSFSFSPDVDASFLLSDPRERKTVAPAVTKVSTPSSRSAGFTFSSGCRVPEVSGARYVGGYGIHMATVCMNTIIAVLFCVSGWYCFLTGDTKRCLSHLQDGKVGCSARHVRTGIDFCCRDLLIEQLSNTQSCCG